MGIVYVVLGVVAVIALRIALRTLRNLKTINDGEEVIRVTLTGLREKGLDDLADIEESKMTDETFANDAYLTVVGKGYSGHHRNKENFAITSAVAIIAGNRPNSAAGAQRAI
jgi:hypothetical protein